MTVKYRKFKTAIITLGGVTDYSCQIMEGTINNNTDEGDKFNTFCADGTGEHQEVPEPDWSVSFKWKADWTPSGLSRYVHEHDGEELECTIQIDNAVADWDRTWTGTLTVREPGDGGEAAGNQEGEVEWSFLGKPELTFADE